MKQFVWTTATAAFLAAAAPAAAQTPQIIAGSMPRSGLVQTQDGSIYGTTWAGGSSKACATTGYYPPYPTGCGTVFRIDPTGVASSIYKFSGKESSGPGPIAVGSDGNLYGMTDGDLNDAVPIAYKLSTSGNGFSKISKVNGQIPTSASFLSLGGKLYLPDYSGHSIFVLEPGQKLKYLSSIGSLNEYGMESGLVVGSDGALYGAQSGDPSCIYRVPLKGTASNLYCTPLYDDREFANQLSFGSDGKLYGMTQGGGANGYGQFFSLANDGTYTDLNDLMSDTGNSGGNGLTLGADGNFYGLTFEGGSYFGGSLVQATTAGSVADLFNFGEAVNAGMPNYYYPSGAYASGAPLKAQDGTFWGVTQVGGVLVTENCGQGCKTYFNNGFGTVFHYDPVANKLTVVIWFSGR